MHQYAPLVLKHFRRPHFVGTLPCDAPGVLVGHAGHQSMGTEIIFYFKCTDNKIVETAFKVFGDPYSIAMGDHVCAQLKDKPITAIDQFTLAHFQQHFQFPRIKRGNALLVQAALQKIKACYLKQEEAIHV